MYQTEVNGSDGDFNKGLTGDTGVRDDYSSRELHHERTKSEGVLCEMIEGQYDSKQTKNELVHKHREINNNPTLVANLKKDINKLGLSCAKLR